MTLVLDGVSGQRHAPEGNKVLRKILGMSKEADNIVLQKATRHLLLVGYWHQCDYDGLNMQLGKWGRQEM
jgi:hypothetical protein